MSAFSDDFVTIHHGDAWQLAPTLEPQSIHTIVTSPPYWGLRDYGEPSQFGLESTPEEYVARLVSLFALLRPALRDDGTVWLNLGDSYARSGGEGDCGPNAAVGNTRSGNQRRMCKIPEAAPSFRDNPFTDGSPRAASTTSGSCDHTTLKPKDLIMVPARCALALQADGWFLRSEIVWAKPNGMPGSQTDRCTSAHEMVYMLSKSPRYWSDFDAIKTPPKESTRVRLAQDVQAQAGSHRAVGKTNGPMKAVGGKQRGHSRRHDGFNDRWDQMTRAEQQAEPAMMRDVWFVAPEAHSWAHFAMMPREIARRCILAGCPEGGTVLDPFMGSGTTAQVARSLGRKSIGFELNAEYIEIAAKHRLAQGVLV